MASTSLAEQLKKLSTPQSTIYQDNNKTPSLLFEAKEAALKDRHVFYEIGVSGLKELVALYEGFRIFEDTLYSISSKDFERAVQSKEVNSNLVQTIEKFLLHLSPYLLLQSSHKALEWLVNRYHIHQYNQDAIMALILPYHETNIFVRFLQIMDLKNSNRWSWLSKVKKANQVLTKQMLHNQCSSNNATLQFIAKSTLTYVNEFGERASQLNTVYAFYCSTVVGTINSGKVTQGIINALLPTMIKGLESPIIDFRSASYVTLGYLSLKSGFKEDTFNEIVIKILTTDFDLSYDMTLLINLMFSNQNHIKKFSYSILYNISLDLFSNMCLHLKQMIDQGISVKQLVIAFLSSVLSLMQNDSEEFRRFSQYPVMLIDTIDLNNQQPEEIIKCVIETFQSYQSQKLNEDGNESDIEIIDEQNYMPEKIIEWFCGFFKSIENNYPTAFDNVLQQVFDSKKKTGKKYSLLVKALTFKPAVARQVGETYLFENLNNVNPDLRVEGVKYITQEFESLKVENKEFVRDSIVARFHDDNVDVVTAALEIPTKNLQEVLTEEDVTEVFAKIMSKTSRKWASVVTGAVTKFCALDSLPVNHETVLALVPYLFPYNKHTETIAWHIIISPWGDKFALSKKLKSVKRNNFENIQKLAWTELFENRTVEFDKLLDSLKLDKSNTLEISLYMLLKTCSFDVSSIEEITDILNLLLESVDNREIVSSSMGTDFDPGVMSEFIKLARKGKILFEVMEYILSRIIYVLPIKEISKPWCNVCASPATILVRRLYDIFLTGCSIVSYSENYAKLLNKLLNKYCRNPKEKFEFVANFACGHILYAADPEDVISPELQLKSLKLLNNFICVQENANWMFEADTVILMLLFNFNNPITYIRLCALDIMKNLLSQHTNKVTIYVQLMKEIQSRKEEITLDHEQIPQALNNILHNQQPGTKVFRKNCLLKLTSILQTDTPPHVTSEFLQILNDINTSNAFSYIVPTLNKLQQVLSKKETEKSTFDIYESKLLRNICGRINETTVSAFANQSVWTSILWALSEHHECVLEENLTFTTPSILVMKQINEEVFKKVPEDKCKDLIYLITSAGTFSNNSKISSVASKVMKKIHIQFSDFKQILNEMLNAVDPAEHGPKKSKSTISMISYQLSETKEWRLGVTLLEYVQNKKKMTVDNAFVSLLFEILKKCLRFEEQSYVEYTKQLIMSSLWYYCKKFVDDSDTDQAKSLKLIFNIELVVQCIRGTQNPQTHHHALILLSHAAYMLPEQVLHHTMEIFTFMGSSVLRHDDAYSFQIIIKIIETLIPILVKLDKDINSYSKKEIVLLQKRVVPVLRIFADVVLHVPEHRRLPLYKKLIETLGAEQFLWVFLGLLLETHIAHFNENKEKDKSLSRTLADQESPITRLDFGQSILLEFSPETCLENFIKLMDYLKSLPLQKDENSMETEVDPSDIFSVNGHSQIQLRHYKYVLITFMNTCLGSSRFIQHSTQVSNTKTMENHYKTFIINILTFIQSISKISDDKTAKYWRVMLHHSYELLDNTNNLLSAPMFVSVIRGLLKHNLQTVRRKSMELLNSKIQFSPELFSTVDRQLLHSLLPALIDIVKTVEKKDESLSEIAAQELELNQQTALLSLKLLTRILATEDPEPFKPVLEIVTEYTCNTNISGNVMASIVLCLAELCGNLKAHALSSLRKFMPALIKVLKKQRKVQTPELVLLSTVTAISKIVESLPLFLSPYLEIILYEYSILYAKWQSEDQKCSKVSAIVSKLSNIKKKIASSIPPRVLIPVANETHNLLLGKEYFNAFGPVMAVLADSFANVTTADFTALQQDLTNFFLSALQLRSDAVGKDTDPAVIDKAEDEIVNALVCLVLKLSESSFRPFYFKIYDWAIRTNVEGHKDRVITFYRISTAIAEKLKGLFVLFSGHFIKNAAELLDSCNNSKTEELYFDSEEKNLTLIKYIIKTLHVVFLYDSQNFINKDRFETLMQPIVDQLENTVGGIANLRPRATEIIIPCISQFAVATADDSLWKLLNYQILLKTRHNDAEVRLAALDCLVATATQLGSSWLPLLAESVPFFAELLEDGDPKIEASTKDAIRKLEQILGEPLEKYF